jgi:hypothetical protein
MRKLLCPLVISAQARTGGPAFFGLHLGARDGRGCFIYREKNVERQKRKTVSRKGFLCVEKCCK